MYPRSCSEIAASVTLARLVPSINERNSCVRCKVSPLERSRHISSHFASRSSTFFCFQAKEKTGRSPPFVMIVLSLVSCCLSVLPGYGPFASLGTLGGAFAFPLCAFRAEFSARG